MTILYYFAAKVHKKNEIHKFSELFLLYDSLSELSVDDTVKVASVGASGAHR